MDAVPDDVFMMILDNMTGEEMHTLRKVNKPDEPNSKWLRLKKVLKETKRENHPHHLIYQRYEEHRAVCYLKKMLKNYRDIRLAHRFHKYMRLVNGGLDNYLARLQTVEHSSNNLTQAGTMLMDRATLSEYNQTSSYNRKAKHYASFSWDEVAKRLDESKNITDSEKQIYRRITTPVISDIASTLSKLSV